eukprot:TRINITY_DN675_c0_g1_i4.p1 TRINITY_DN675_c0_g1~~TRINITY_DN675_c0_g1_i4.p1  ORF type:complete len:212 (+),score=45.26 TRINITY_DN675_c0_g1_i4:337-972(+)
MILSIIKNMLTVSPTLVPLYPKLVLPIEFSQPFGFSNSSPASGSSSFFYSGSSLMLIAYSFCTESGPVVSFVIEPDCELHIFGDRLLFMQTVYALFKGAALHSPSVIKVVVSNASFDHLQLQMTLSKKEKDKLVVDRSNDPSLPFFSAARAFTLLLDGSFQCETSASGEKVITLLIPQSQGIPFSHLMMKAKHHHDQYGQPFDLMRPISSE